MHLQQALFVYLEGADVLIALKTAAALKNELKMMAGSSLAVTAGTSANRWKSILTAKRG